MDTPFQHVVIIGCGLLGTSLGLALRQKNLAKLITGVGRSGSPSVLRARERGALDRSTDDAVLAVSGGALPGASPVLPADLIILATPVRQFPEMFRKLASAVAPGTIFTDVGSTKAQVMQWAAELLPPHVQFVGSHPMAGSEKHGPEAARADLYNNAVCLVCQGGNSSPQAYQRVMGLWQALGMRVIPCDAAEHDRWVATISHLPYALATALVNTASADPAALATAAGGFTDTSRIASGEVTMWTDIMLTNRQAVSEIIGTFQGHLAALQAAVERGDETAIRAFFTTAKTARDAFLAQRRHGTNGTSG